MMFFIAGSLHFLSSQNTPKSKKGQVYFFLSPECPLCISYVPILNSLYDWNKQNEITCTAIVSGIGFDKKTIENYCSNYNLKLPLKVDSAYRISKRYHASVTPEVVFTDENDKLLYKGKIDNWVVAPGKKRARATEFYLKDAITHYLNNDSIIIKSTPAIGCFIE